MLRSFAAAAAAPAARAQFPVPFAHFPLARSSPLSLSLSHSILPPLFFFISLSPRSFFIVSLTKRRALYADCALSQTFCFWLLQKHLLPHSACPRSSLPSNPPLLGYPCAGRSSLRALVRLVFVSSLVPPARPLVGAGTCITGIGFDNIEFIVTSSCNYPC